MVQQRGSKTKKADFRTGDILCKAQCQIKIGAGVHVCGRGPLSKVIKNFKTAKSRSRKGVTGQRASVATWEVIRL